MELNRNQFFMAGIFVLLIGIQFRLLDSATLNEKTTAFLVKHSAAASTMAIMPLSPKKIIHPAPWIGWCFISVGAVCILHSLAMKKPGG